MRAHEPTAGAKRAKPYDIRERTFEFGVRALEIASQFPDGVQGRVLGEQLVRSGISIGANVEEADGSVTKAEKRRSLVVARREARETRYWIRLAVRRWGRGDEWLSAAEEAREIVCILSTIIDKLS